MVDKRAPRCKGKSPGIWKKRPDSAGTWRHPDRPVRCAGAPVNDVGCLVREVFLEDISGVWEVPSRICSRRVL